MLTGCLALAHSLSLARSLCCSHSRACLLTHSLARSLCGAAAAQRQSYSALSVALSRTDMRALLAQQSYTLLPSAISKMLMCTAALTALPLRMLTRGMLSTRRVCECVCVTEGGDLFLCAGNTYLCECVRACVCAHIFSLL